MAQFEEKNSVSQFVVQPNGCISVRRTTEIMKDGQVVSTSHWRGTLVPNDPQAASVLDSDYYMNLAQQAWTPEVVAAYKAQEAAMLASLSR